MIDGLKDCGVEFFPVSGDVLFFFNSLTSLMSGGIGALKTSGEDNACIYPDAKLSDQFYGQFMTPPLYDFKCTHFHGVIVQLPSYANSQDSSDQCAVCLCYPSDGIGFDYSIEDFQVMPDTTCSFVVINRSSIEAVCRYISERYVEIMAEHIAELIHYPDIALKVSDYLVQHDSIRSYLIGQEISEITDISEGTTLPVVDRKRFAL